MPEPLLTVTNLRMVFQNKFQRFPAVDGISFSVERGQILGIVGESGSGKTMVSLSLMGLLPPQGVIESDGICFKGIELTKQKERALCRIRGKDISMIFQDPVMSLDQVFTVGYQIVEAIRAHEKISRAEAKERAIGLLSQVGIPEPGRVFAAYPFELSGGMCQRVMIAIALCCNPTLLIADEPTTALDVTVQAQILELLKQICRQYNIGIIFITHDLDVVADMADNVMVMYAGKMMEVAPAEELFRHPCHMYTRGLIRSVPRSDLPAERLDSIEGTVPDIRSMPRGCRFCTRCPIADQRCINEQPPMIALTPSHSSCCWKAESLYEGGGAFG